MVEIDDDGAAQGPWGEGDRSPDALEAARKARGRHSGAPTARRRLLRSPTTPFPARVAYEMELAEQCATTIWLTHGEPRQYWMMLMLPLI
jgi:hypothetical protein